MKFRNSLLVAVATAALLSTGSCGGSSEPIVGAILPVSGAAQGYGEMVRSGMDLALEEINAAGGIEGQPLKIIYEDSATDPATGAAAARKLIEKDGVPLIIGGVSSSVTMDILTQVTDPAKVVTLSPASSSPNLTGKSPYFFRVYPSDSLEGARMVDLASDELRLRKLVVFSANNQYGAGYKKAFIERYRRKKNREVLKVHNHAPDETDYSALIAETQSLGPDGLFLIGYNDSLATLVKQIRAAGMTVPILTSGSITSEFPALAGEAGEGVLFSRANFRVIGNKDLVDAFVATYRAKYGKEPEAYSAYGYDAVKLAAQVMAQGNRAARDIHLAMRTPQAKYEGVTGTIAFGNEGDVVASPTTYIVTGGKLVVYADHLEQNSAPPADAADESTAGAGPGR